jgi:hypothetical protein
MAIRREEILFIVFRIFPKLRGGSVMGSITGSNFFIFWTSFFFESDAIKMGVGFFSSEAATVGTGFFSSEAVTAGTGSFLTVAVMAGAGCFMSKVLTGGAVSFTLFE